MDRRFTLLVVFFILYLVTVSSFAGTPKYGEVLYRINCGGIEQFSLDGSPVNWATDNSATPCQFVDVGVMGNRTYGTTDNITMDASVPSYVPPYIFNIERNLFNTFVDSLEYHFPIPYGKKVEVRLYFAELYFNNIGDRVFDIYVENQLQLKDLDIVKEVGKNVGIMKSYQATSDGMINIFMKKVKQLPKINGIEIIAIDELTTFYRVNSGGLEVNSVEIAGTKWIQDDNNSPCVFVNTVASGNKVYSVPNTIVVSAAVPTTTPNSIFKSQRLLDNSQSQDLVYNFPVAFGQKVDVRLYFAELIFDNSGERVFDILIEDKIFGNDVDLVAQHGKFNGTFNEVTLVSDGIINIKLRRQVGDPVINGIEIVESNKDISVVSSIFNSYENSNGNLKAYPNPFKDETNVSLDNGNFNFIKVIDIYGSDVPFEVEKTDTNARIQIDYNYPKGIYFLLIGEDDKNISKLKLVKY